MIIVQESLGKVADCEQVRQCGDLLEQLRFLIGGSRGQRFVVNINVPSQVFNHFVLFSFFFFHF